MTLAIAAGALVAGAVYLFSRREMLRVILGFVLLTHGVNLVIMAAGGTDRREPPLGSDLDTAVTADPLPQAFILTAIVIAFSITIVMLVLAITGRRNDDLRDDQVGIGGPLPSQPDLSRISTSRPSSDRSTGEPT